MVIGKRYTHTICDDFGNTFTAVTSTDLPEYAQLVTDLRVRAALEAAAADLGLEIVFQRGIEELEYDLAPAAAACQAHQARHGAGAGRRFSGMAGFSSLINSAALAFVGTGIGLAGILG